MLFRSKVSITNSTQTIGSFINQVEKETGYMLVYNKKEVDVLKSVTLNKGEKSVAECLKAIFNNSEITYVIEDDYIILTKHHNSAVQGNLQDQKVISGIITDSSGESIIGANVFVKGTTQGTITDIDGRFSLDVPTDNAILVVSYIGYLEQQIPVKGRKDWNIILKDDLQKLDEVVVVGYGVQRKVTTTGAVSKIEGDALNRMTVVDTKKALHGLSAGVTVIDRGGAPGGDDTDIYLRGVGTTGDRKSVV